MKKSTIDSNAIIESARKKYCGKKQVRFWGTDYKIRPVLLPAIFGDGLKVMWLEPMASRPEYYVILGDSKWGTNNTDPNPFCDHLEDVYCAIETNFGSADDERESGERMKAFEKRTEWPALDTSCGINWGEFNE